MGDLVEDFKVEWDSSKKSYKFLHRPLPEGVADIETVMYHNEPNEIKDKPTLTLVSYVGKDKSDDDNNISPPLLLRSGFSDNESDCKKEATKTARSNNKLKSAMYKTMIRHVV